MKKIILSLLFASCLLGQLPPNQVYVGAYVGTQLPAFCNNRDLFYNVNTYIWYSCGPINSWSVFGGTGGGLPSGTGFVVINNGVGATVTVSGGVSGVQGTGPKAQMATGAFVSGDIIKYDVNGNAVDSGFPAGSTNVNVQQAGSTVGAGNTLNFIPAQGVTLSIAQVGNTFNITQGTDNAIIPTKPQIQQSTSTFVAGGGTANAQTANYTPVITVLTQGTYLCWLPSAANTIMNPTLSVNGITGVTIVKANGAVLAANDYITTAIACVIYDGTNFELQNPQTSTSSSGGPQYITLATGVNITSNSTLSTPTGLTSTTLATGRHNFQCFGTSTNTGTVGVVFSPFFSGTTSSAGYQENYVIGYPSTTSQQVFLVGGTWTAMTGNSATTTATGHVAMYSSSGSFVASSSGTFQFQVAQQFPSATPTPIDANTTYCQVQ